MEKLDIVCFGSDWEGHPSSVHHLIKQLKKQHRVLWINSLGMRTPTASSQDIGRIFTKAGRLLKNILPKKQGHDFWVLEPFYLPFQGNKLAEGFNRFGTVSQLKIALNKIGFKNPVVLTALPNSIELIKSLQTKAKVYYCLDDFRQMPGVSGESIAKQEQELIKNADFVMVSAEKLKEHLQASKSIKLLTHGVDLQSFAEPGPIPAALDKIPKPRIGFFGALDTWLDLDLIAEVAKRKPEWHFPIVGPSRVDISRLQEIKNIHFLGAVPYEDIPSYAVGFDVGTLPFLVNDFTMSVNPLKLREYLAAGIPAISTGLREVRSYQPHVKIGDSAQEWIDAIQEFLDSPPSPESLQKAVASEGWEMKAQQFQNWLQSHIQQVVS